jgi:isopentenyl diphosphate isomerase/L-lactate dehydrogenase-like FMN-dependent dehydrogenase
VSTKFVNIDDLRRAAKRTMPKAMFDYVDGGANGEWTQRRNQAEFERIMFDPRVLVDVSQRDQSTTVFGQRLETPIIVAPTGLTAIAWPNAELLAARAARRAGAGFSLSTFASASIEEIAATGVSPLWFQLYVSTDREWTHELVDRAQASGYQALAITVDTQIPSTRERNIRNGYQSPPRITLDNVVDFASHVGWLYRFLKGPRPALGNTQSVAALTAGQFVELGSRVARDLDPSVSWRDVDALRARWKGPMLLKGVVSTRDVARALDVGVDGFIVSNHGGRQLDYAPSSIEVLPEIVDACGGRAEVYLDSGVRRGSDIVKAIALGARAVLIGRACVYGLGANGGDGVDHVFRILKDEIDKCLALIGAPCLSQLGRENLRLPACWR